MINHIIPPFLAGIVEDLYCLIPTRIALLVAGGASVNVHSIYRRS
jgi:hypothetical protein